VVVHVLGDSGVVDQRIEPAEAGRGVGYSAAIGILGDVALHDLGLGAGLTHGVSRGLGFGPALGIVEDDGLGPAFGGAHGNGRAQAGRRAGHQDDPAVEVPHL
jgi:hypothetical protein